MNEALNSSLEGSGLGIQYSYLSIDKIRKETIIAFVVIKIKSFPKRLFNKYGVKN
jgi:hypothetical protein